MNDGHNGFFFITGATSGIGEAAALQAIDHGYHVIAGCFPDIDEGSELNRRAPDRVSLIRLDVADEHSISEAGNAIAVIVGERGLSGLVNSAGVALLCPAELITVKEFRRVIDINLTGTFAVTREVLPLLRKAGGNIVNISSDGGFLAMPTGAAYCASKFAVEALSDVLRAELCKQGISVVVVEPGNIDTPLWETLHQPTEEKIATLDDNYKHLYGSLLDTVLATGRQGIPVERVGETVFKALTRANPRHRYRVGADAHISKMISKLPSKLRDWCTLKVIDSYSTNKS